MNLDTLASLFTGLVSLAAFTIFIFTSHERRQWMTFPEYVRRGFFGAGVVCMWRSVNLISLAADPSPIPGHANFEGIMAFGSMAYLMCGFAYWIVSDRLSPTARDRLAWVASALRLRPNAVPLMMRPDEITEISRASGAYTIGPGEGVSATTREARRMQAPPT